jgi:hypothetical protein
LPEETSLDATYWDITVEWRGGTTWAVLSGSGHTCLGRGGEWDYEPQPSSRTDEWIATHRFSEDEALALAKSVIGTVRVNGKTAQEHLAWVEARNGGSTPS